METRTFLGSNRNTSKAGNLDNLFTKSESQSLYEKNFNNILKSPSSLPRIKNTVESLLERIEQHQTTRNNTLSSLNSPKNKKSSFGFESNENSDFLKSNRFMRKAKSVLRQSP